MLLPHGYDGNGPEHSSSRVERYLQLCSQDDEVPGDGVNYDNKDLLRDTNMQVVNCSTAANYFHVLRTHMRMPFRKPLIVIAPKKLLKLKAAGSSIEEFAENTRFQNLIGDQHDKLVPADKVKKVVLCSGQVYYDLIAQREKTGRNDIAILRCESLCPFPFKEIIAQLKTYKNAEVTWAQEEPKNAGAWLYAEPRVNNILDFMKRRDSVVYAGRPIMAASAVGYTATHNQQLAQLLADAMK